MIVRTCACVRVHAYVCMRTCACVRVHAYVCMCLLLQLLEALGFRIQRFRGGMASSSAQLHPLGAWPREIRNQPRSIRIQLTTLFGNLRAERAHCVAFYARLARILLPSHPYGIFEDDKTQFLKSNLFRISDFLF